MNASGSAEFNIRTIPPGLAAEVEKNPAVLDAIGKTNWALLRDVSRGVETGGLTGVSETKYMSFPVQREFFQSVRGSKAIPGDIKLVLQDLIIQYYFFTCSYHFSGPREQEFGAGHLEFLQGLGVEYAWVEPAGQNYYQHTFLKKLIKILPESRWGKFYREIYAVTAFEEIPREGEGGDGEKKPAAAAPRSSVHIPGEVREGRAFEKYFGPGFHFRLEPRPSGWEIVVSYLGGEENIARLTPPFHFVPNPREIEGWHFRNSDNSGANEPGEKNVNAPQEEREFIFSPEVGLSIQGPGAGRAVNGEDVEKVRAFGQGRLTILESRLGNLKPGEQAKFEWMRFEVELSWPGDFAPPG